MIKVGYVSIVGKPNVGKSTLINKLIGFKVAITTPKPQTTRFNIRGILNTENAQIIFTDTPGIHTPKNNIGKYMMNGVSSAIKNTDIILYMVDSTKPKIDKASENIMENISKLNKKVFLVINKIDKIDKEKLFSIITEYSSYAEKLNMNFCEVIPISIFKNDGLELLTKLIEDNLDYSEKIYEDDEFTDMTERQIVEENIREKLLNNLDEEVPHGLNVVVDSFSERINSNGALVYDIDASIICSKSSHKPIIIGKNGSKLNHIRNLAKIDLENILTTKINLKLWVKVKENWMENDAYTQNIKSKTN